LTANFLLLSAGEFLTKLLTFAAFLVVARALGPARYGGFEFVLAVMAFLSLAGDFGLLTYAAREIARDRRRAVALVNDVTTLRLVLGLLCLGALLGFVALVPQAPEIQGLLLLYGATLLATPTIVQWLFQGQDLMHWVALASVLRRATFTALVLVFFRAGKPLVCLGVYELASVLAVAALCLGVLRFRLGFPWPRPSFQPLRLLGHFRNAFAIGVSELAFSGVTYFPTLLIGLLIAGQPLGWFSASLRIIVALHAFVWLYFYNLLPSLSRCPALPKERLRGLMRPSLGMAACGGIFAALGLTVFAPQLLGLAFGPGFEGGASVLRLLAWNLPLALVSGHYRYGLIAYNRQKSEAICSLAAAAVLVVLSLWLVPVVGITGAAVALLVGKAVNLGLAYTFMGRSVAWIPFREALTRPLVATAVGLGAYFWLKGLDPWLAGGACLGTYVACLVAWERERVRALLGGGFQQPTVRLSKQD
jgi:O-antigen/teichoic acid export membrane protein